MRGAGVRVNETYRGCILRGFAKPYRFIGIWEVSRPRLEIRSPKRGKCSDLRYQGVQVQGQVGVRSVGGRVYVGPRQVVDCPIFWPM